MTRRAILPLLLAGFACRDASPAPVTRDFDGAQALRYIETQVGFGPRVPGTEGHRQMSAWLDSLLRTRTDSVIAQRWNHVTSRGDTVAMANLIARFNPAATERILVLAHWDTRPISDGPGASPEERATPVPGANDGGSGVAVLLGVADRLKAVPPSIGVDLLFVDGEDFGTFDADRKDVLIGSRYYARNQPAGTAPLFAVLFDMVGDRDLRIQQEYNSLTGAPEVVERVWNAARELGYQQYFVAHESTNLVDDHVELQAVGIRAIDVVDFDYGPGNSWWHTPNDTIDKVSGESLAIVGNVAMRVIANASR